MISRLVTLFWQQVNQFLCELPFICRAFDKEASSTNLKLWIWLGRELNPGPPRHGANALTTRLPIWLRSSQLFYKLDFRLYNWCVSLFLIISLLFFQYTSCNYLFFNWCTIIQLHALILTLCIILIITIDAFKTKVNDVDNCLFMCSIIRFKILLLLCSIC